MISIVIPAYNEERRIARCLDALARQITAEQIEVIVVNNASSDRTAEIAESFQDRLNVRVVYEPVRRRGAARAAGCAVARGEILFGIDADSVPTPDWVETFVEAFRANPKVVGIAGTTRIEDCNRLTNVVYDFGWPLSLYLYRLFMGHFSLSGHNFAVRRDAYEQAGGFDPTFDALEDVDLTSRVSKIGKIKLLRHPKILISGRRFRKGFLRGLFEYISSYIEIYWLDRGTVEMSSLQ